MSDHNSIHHRLAISIRMLGPSDLEQVRRMVATAFAAEPFAFGMFGESPVDRFVGMIGQYENWPEAPNPLVLVASAGPSIVAVALSILPGECHLCDDWEPTLEAFGHEPTVAESIESEFQSRCRSAHLSSALPSHAHIQTVVTEQFLAGAGIGRQIMNELLQRLHREGARCVVLECLSTRRAFYERCGFRGVAQFADPGGDDLSALLMQIDASENSFETSLQI